MYYDIKIIIIYITDYKKYYVINIKYYIIIIGIHLYFKLNI